MPSVSVSGIVTSAVSAFDSLAVTVTEDPSGTGFGAADSRTVGDEVPVSSNFHVHCAVTSGASLSLYSNPSKPAKACRNEDRGEW